MPEPRTLRVLTATVRKDPVARQAMAIPSLENLLERFEDVPLSTLAENLGSTLHDIGSVLEKASLKFDGMKLEQIRFALSVEAEGKISLVSLAGASAGGSATIEFVLKRS